MVGDLEASSVAQTDLDATKEVRAGPGSDGGVDNCSDCLAHQPLCEGSMYERTRKNREDWGASDSYHAFDIRQMVELQGFYKDSLFSGCHVTLDSHNKDSILWTVQVHGISSCRPAVNTQYFKHTVNEGFPLEDFCRDARHKSVDEMNASCSCKYLSDSDDIRLTRGESVVSRYSEAVPGASTGSLAYNALPRDNVKHEAYMCPYHILFNLAGTCLTIYHRHIEGTHAQQSFIQRLASTMVGILMSLLFLMAACFPCHLNL